MTYPTTKLDRAVDRAIARENKRVASTQCRKCAGTGHFYTGPDAANRWTQHTCDRCNGTGLR